MISKPICGAGWVPERPATGTFVCALAELPDGGGRMFALPAATGEFRLLVLRSGERCLGYENRCPHFGVPLAACDAQLIVRPHESVSCNTHYARFRWEDGYCESGDCEGESLVPVPLIVRDGKVSSA
jgi:nitrite reductase/ring-hydroxylating ferredoxin subunit